MNKKLKEKANNFMEAKTCGRCCYCQSVCENEFTGFKCLKFDGEFHMSTFNNFVCDEWEEEL